MPKLERIHMTTIEDVRRAVADYMASEGCSCCRGSDHGEHKAKLGELLDVPKYADDSGYDFSQFRSKQPSEDA